MTGVPTRIARSMIFRSPIPKSAQRRGWTSSRAASTVCAARHGVRLHRPGCGVRRRRSRVWIGLWAAFRHQRKFNERLHASSSREPARLDSDARLVMEARRAADTYVFDPALAIDVSEQMLRERPADWHGKTIRVTATWSLGIESSFIGPAWVRPMSEGQRLAPGQHRVRAAGLWVFPRAPHSTQNMSGFGHLGMSWGEFRVYELGIE